MEARFEEPVWNKRVVVRNVVVGERVNEVCELRETLKTAAAESRRERNRTGSILTERRSSRCSWFSGECCALLEATSLQRGDRLPVRAVVVTYLDRNNEVRSVRASTSRTRRDDRLDTDGVPSCKHGVPEVVCCHLGNPLEKTTAEKDT